MGEEEVDVNASTRLPTCVDRVNHAVCLDSTALSHAHSSPNHRDAAAPLLRQSTQTPPDRNLSG